MTSGSEQSAYLEWLQPAFDWLAGKAGEDSDEDWEQLKRGFLEQLGLAENQLDDPQYRVVQLLMTYVDDEFTDDDDRLDFLLDEQDRQRRIGEWVAQAAQEYGGEAATSTAGSGGAAVQPQYVEGIGWMQWDESAAEWVAMDASGDAAADHGAAGAAAGVSSAADEHEPVAPPEEVAALAVEEIAVPALAEVLAEAPEIAEIPFEELQVLLGQIVAERLSVAAEE